MDARKVSGTSGASGGARRDSRTSGRRDSRTSGMGVVLLGLVLGVGAGVVPVARGDQVIAGHVNYTDATIVNLEAGRLLFQTTDGEERSIWLSDVERLTVDAAGMFLDFNQAERYVVDGEPSRAIVRYRRTLRRTDGMWGDLIAARLVTACGRADRTDQAALFLIRVARGRWGGPALAVRIIPRTEPTDPEQAAGAVKHLDGAIGAATSLETRIPLQLYRYGILRSIDPQRAMKAASELAALLIPEPLRCDRVYEILLPALTQLLDERVDAEALAALDRAMRYCRKELLPGFLLLKGNALLRTATSREDYIRAAWPFMRVAIHMPRDPRAAEGLRGAAVAVERIGRPDQAIELLSECLAHKRVGKRTRRMAEQALARLQPDKQVP